MPFVVWEAHPLEGHSSLRPGDPHQAHTGLNRQRQRVSGRDLPGGRGAGLPEAGSREQLQVPPHPA